MSDHDNLLAQFQVDLSSFGPWALVWPQPTYSDMAAK